MEFKGTKEEAAHEYFKQGQLGFQKASDTEEAFYQGCIWFEKNSKHNEMLDLLNYILKESENGHRLDEEDLEDIQNLIKQATEI